MPFISDDCDHHLVDDEEYVAQRYKDYVIVRKLYVWLDKPFPDDDYLYRRFKKYGIIESTEVLESGKDGFVTFTCDRHACLAYDREKEKCVEIAYTWHQAREAQMDNEDRLHQQDQSIDTSSLLQLNDDCLFAVFDLCDNRTLVHLSETCTRFNTLLTSAYKFPKNKELEFYGYDDYCGRLLSLAAVRKIVRLMGPFFEKLDLCFIDLEDKTKALRYFQMAMKYCKSNTFRELKLVTHTWKEEFDTLLGPILKDLQILELNHLDSPEDDVFLPDFTALCPNLKKIVIDVFVEEFSPITIPNLESFSFENYLTNLTNTSNALEFFANNPQIRVFKCSDLLSKDLRNIAIHLPNVRKLSFGMEEVSSSNDFQHLRKFEHLTQLKLRFVPFLFREMPNINITETIECFRGLNNLTELKLYFKQDNKLLPREIQQSISKMLPNLECFDLVGFKLLESTVVNFVRYAERLKSLHLHIGNVYATKSLITKLATLRKSRRQDILQLHLDDDSRNDVAAVNATDVQEYLSVDWNCSHDLRFVENRK